MPDSYIQSISGVYDWQGTRRDYPHQQSLTVQGRLAGDDDIASTSAGNVLVDGRGYPIGTGRSGEYLASGTEHILAVDVDNDFALGDKRNRLRAQFDDCADSLGVRAGCTGGGRELHSGAME